MELYLAVIIVALVFVTVLSILVMRRPALKRRYEALDERRLVEVQAQSKKMRRNTRIGAYLVPLPLLFMSVLVHDKPLINTFLGICFFASFGLLFAARVFGEIERLATAEMERRKLTTDPLEDGSVCSVDSGERG